LPPVERVLDWREKGGVLQDGFDGGIFSFPGGSAGGAAGLTGCVEAGVVCVVVLEGGLASEGGADEGLAGGGMSGDGECVEGCFGGHGVGRAAGVEHDKVSEAGGEEE
jgi:hypothetical protein